MSTTRLTLRRTATVTALAAVSVLAAAGIAAAHVTVHPESYAKGATDGVLTFRVPNEEDTAATTKVQVYLPTDHPVLGVLVTPHDGWTAKVTTTKLKTPVKTDDGTITEAPIRVTWTADSGVQIAPGQFQQFTVSAGAVPKTGSVTLPTHQYYSDGTVVDWDQPTPASGKEPEHPAPTLYIEDSAPAEDGATQLVATAAPQPEAAGAGTTATVVSIALGVGGLALGAIALVVAVFALTRTGRRVERKVQG